MSCLGKDSSGESWGPWKWWEENLLFTLHPSRPFEFSSNQTCYLFKWNLFLRKGRKLGIWGSHVRACKRGSHLHFVLPVVMSLVLQRSVAFVTLPCETSVYAPGHLCAWVCPQNLSFRRKYCSTAAYIFHFSQHLLSTWVSLQTWIVGTVVNTISTSLWHLAGIGPSKRPAVGPGAQEVHRARLLGDLGFSPLQVVDGG